MHNIRKVVFDLLSAEFQNVILFPQSQSFKQNLTPRRTRKSQQISGLKWREKNWLKGYLWKTNSQNSNMYGWL